ncbi:MAG: DUF4160 domain-containing protein [Campylobacterales bacterium]
MPTLLVEEGFKFFFYANEHEPMHVHVMKGDGFAKIELKSFRIVQNYLKPKELKRALAIMRTHQLDFERAWHEWFD